MVGTPSWERTGGGRGGWGGRIAEHAFALKGALNGGANPGTGVDVSFGAQAGEGVVDVWRDTDQLVVAFEGRLSGEQIANRPSNGIFPFMIARCLLTEICGLRRLLVRRAERVAQRGQQGLTLLRHSGRKRVDTLTPNQISAD